MIVIFIYCLK